MRQIVLDTETTGLEVSEGHRIIEIGAVELIDRRVSGRNFHQYVNPERDIDDGALEVHGITNEYLLDKPRFSDIAQDLLDFIDGDDLIIHNADFDLGFLDTELAAVEMPMPGLSQTCTVIDTLAIARDVHPGQRNSLDALCRRYEIDNSQRTLHGALLDAEILADVYLAMTGGQTDLSLDFANLAHEEADRVGVDFVPSKPLVVLRASDEELSAHQDRLQTIRKKSGECLWLDLESEIS